MRDWIVGAEVTRLSMMIASRRPMFVSVTTPNFLAPSLLNVKLTAGRLFWSTDGRALVRSRPLTAAALRTV